MKSEAPVPTSAVCWTPGPVRPTTEMSTKPRTTLCAVTLVVVLGGSAFSTIDAAAHCDTMNGPVVTDARRSLATGDVTPVLKWIAAADEDEVVAAFARVLEVRTESDAARELADFYFFETVVRLHRQSEGMSYSGLKDSSSVAPAIAAADQALISGDVGALEELLVEHVRSALHSRFANAREAVRHAEHSVEAGREYVKAYVQFTHLAEELDAVASHATEGRHHEQTTPPPSAAPGHAHYSLGPMGARSGPAFESCESRGRHFAFPSGRDVGGR